MARIRRIRPTPEQHKYWKAEAIGQVSKAAKPFIEGGEVSYITPSYPLPNWLNPGKFLFRSLHDLAAPKTEWNPIQLASLFSERSPSNTIYFPDTGFFTVPMDFRVFDALLTRQLAIPNAIWNELQTWISNPFHNIQMRDYISDCAHSKKHKVEILDSSEFSDFSYTYYKTLLSLRKTVWKKVYADFLQKKRREPSDLELETSIRKSCGDGAEIALKGWRDRRKDNLFADEELVTSAVLTSILRGVEVVILTRDNDISKQLISLTNLINGHYLSMHSANYFSRFRDEYPGLYPPTIEQKPGKSTFPFGAGRVSGIIFNADSGIEFLPPNPMPVIIHCITFDNNKNPRTYSVASFYGETGMRELLCMKEKSGGMNTDKFDMYNCYLTAAPSTDKPRLSFGLNMNDYVYENGVKLVTVDSLHATKPRLLSSQVFYQT